MISYDAIQDVLTAVLVAIVVAVVVALAWLSTYVREQPLVAFVVIHSSNNGEREQSGTSETSARESEPTSARETNESSAPTMEASPVKQTVPDNNSEANKDPGGMEVKPVKNEKAGEIHSKENCDTNLNIERVSDISLKELNVNSEHPSLPSPEPSEGEDGVTNIIKEGVGEDTRDTNNASLPSQSSAERPKDSGSISETELRKRRLQQFISMGDTSNTEHLQRLTEQLTASLPSETTGQPDSSECNESICNEGSKVEEVSSSECKETEVPPSTSSLPQEGTSVKEEKIDPRPPGSIKIRLKFLDETQRHVFAQLTEQVGTFKRQHFSIEMDANRRIRLIFNGQLLSQDTSTLAQYGLFDNCVVHCHVSQPQQTTNTAHNREAVAHEEEDAYVSRLLAPLLYGVLAVMWYLRYEYGHLFNAMSTLILLFLTALLLVSTYLLYVSTPATTSTPTATLSHPRTS